MSQSNSHEPMIAVALRERTIGEKHAYLDGYAAGLRTAAANGWDDDTWLETLELIRETLPPR